MPAIVVPQRKIEADEWLISDTNSTRKSNFVASRIVHDAYLGQSKLAAVVRQFLETEANLKNQLSPADVLGTIANKGNEQPFDLSDDDLKLVRDYLAEVPKEEISALSLRLGEAIQIDAYRWKNGKKQKFQARISECHLPTSIQKEAGGFLLK